MLFELLIAISIFVVTASLTLSALRNGHAGLGRAHQEQLAIDIARSRLSELESGARSLTNLRTGALERIGSIDLAEYPATGTGVRRDLSRWHVELETERSPYQGLTLVTITVYAPDDTARARGYTLRQLIRVRDADSVEFEEDEIMEDLPQPPDSVDPPS